MSDYDIKNNCEDVCTCAYPHEHVNCLSADQITTTELDEIRDAAFHVLTQVTRDDPDPVSILTEGDEQHHEFSVVVLRGQATIEMFRQWAERAGVFHRENGIDGKPRMAK